MSYEGLQISRTYEPNLRKDMKLLFIGYLLFGMAFLLSALMNILTIISMYVYSMVTLSFVFNIMFLVVSFASMLIIVIGCFIYRDQLPEHQRSIITKIAITSIVYFIAVLIRIIVLVYILSAASASELVEDIIYLIAFIAVQVLQILTLIFTKQFFDTVEADDGTISITQFFYIPAIVAIGVRLVVYPIYLFVGEIHSNPIAALILQIVYLLINAAIAVAFIDYTFKFNSLSFQPIAIPSAKMQSDFETQLEEESNSYSFNE
jgi:hypothetical protein